MSDIVALDKCMFMKSRQGDTASGAVAAAASCVSSKHDRKNRISAAFMMVAVEAIEFIQMYLL